MLDEKQVLEEDQLIDQLYQRWIVGYEGTLPMESLPASWHSMISTLPSHEKNLACLALASQHQHILFKTKSATQLKSYPHLPFLSHPLLNDTQRTWFRFILNHSKFNHLNLLVHMIWQRGHMIHPNDYLPQSHDQFPSVYDEWQRWNIEGIDFMSWEQSNPLSVESWSSHSTAMRVKLIKHMRRKDPARAREIIKQCIAQESAQHRIAVLKQLSVQLSLEDVPFLQHLQQTDRSSKVKTLAHYFIARVSPLALDNTDANADIDTNAGADTNTSTDAHAQTDALGEMVYELADTLHVHTVTADESTQQLNTAILIKPKKLKSKKKQAFRSQQLATVLPHHLAQALEISVKTLVTSWDFHAHRKHDNEVFLQQMCHSLPDSLMILCVKHLVSMIQAEQVDVQFLQHVLERLDEQQRVDLFMPLMSQASLEISFHDVLQLLATPLIHCTWQQLVNTYAWKKLIKESKKSLSKNIYIAHSLYHEFYALALLLPHSLTQQVITYLDSIQVIASDAALYLLQLNLSLPPSSSSSSTSSPDSHT